MPCVMNEYEGRRPELAGDVLKKWIARSGLLRVSDRDRIWAAWQQLLGPDAPHTALEGLKGNVAHFTVDSSALLAELKAFRKQELLEGLREEVRTYFVRDLKFRLEKKAEPKRSRKNI